MLTSAAPSFFLQLRFTITEPGAATSNSTLFGTSSEFTGAEWENVTRHAYMRAAASVPKELPPVVPMHLFNTVAVVPP